MRQPIVSVVMSAHNRAAFVAEAIESVLSQTFADFEFLIADDGSDDATASVIASYRDPRIAFTPYPDNLGYPQAYTTLIGRAAGRHVAIMDSDDAWLPHKLETQVAFLESSPDHAAAFAQMQYVDLDGQPLEAQPALAVRDLDLPSPWWLRRFLVSGNCFNHPTALIRHAALESVGLYDGRLRMTADFDLWRRLLRRHRAFVSREILVRYRLHPGHNLSRQGTPEQARRDQFEHETAARRMLDGASIDTLLSGFGDLTLIDDHRSDEQLAIEKALLQTLSELPRSSKPSDLSDLFELFASLPVRGTLIDDYGLSERRFQELSGLVGTGGAGRDQIRSLLHGGGLTPASAPVDAAVPAAGDRIPCVMLGYHDVAAAERTLRNLEPLADRLSVIFVENPSDASDDFQRLVERFMRRGLVTRYFRFDENIRTCAVDVVLRRELALERHPIVIVTEADLEVDSPGWLDEELAVLAGDPLVFAMGLTLDPSNLPLDTIPESSGWIGSDLVGDRGDYVETTTGCYFLMFRGPELAAALDRLNRDGRHFLDAFLHDHCYGTLGRRWARTKQAKAHHIAWDYHADPDHPYTKARFGMSFHDQFYQRRHSGYRELDVERGWVRSDVSDDPAHLLRRSLDAFAEGQLDEGALACDRLLCLRSIRNDCLETTHDNMRFYAQPLATFAPEGALLEFLDGQPGEATMVTVGDALAVVATEPMPGHGGHPARWAQLLSADLTAIGDPVPILPGPAMLAGPDAAAEIAHLRLLPLGSGWVGTAMVASPDGGQAAELALVTIDPGAGEITSIRRMGDALTGIREPGAMPVVVGDRLQVVQQCGPTVVLRADTERGVFALAASHPAPRLCEWFLDGTQLQPLREGHLAVVRERAGAAGHQADLHRFVRFDGHLRIAAISCPFTLLGHARERCTGLALLADSLFLAFTLGEEGARIARVELSSALALLKPVSQVLSEGLERWGAGGGLPASG